MKTTENFDACALNYTQKKKFCRKKYSHDLKRCDVAEQIFAS